MKHTALFAFATVAALAAAGSASAGCASFEVQPSDLRVTYDPFNNRQISKNFQVGVRRASGDITAVRFMLIDSTPRGSKPKIGDFGPNDYDITLIRDESRPVFAWGPRVLVPSNGATATFGSRDDTDRVDFRLRIDAGQAAESAQSIENLEVVYECYSGRDRVGDGVQTDNRVAVELNVTQLFGAYVSSNGRDRAELDFGELNSGAKSISQSVVIMAASTTPYNVEFSTDNGGKLQRSNRSGDGIPYKMTYAGVEVQDGSRLRCPKTPAPSGVSQVLQVTADTTGAASARAGEYRDTITMTFTPRDGAPDACR